MTDDVAAAAVMTARVLANQHGCSRRRPEDPACRHRNHRRDVALLRELLGELGLDGSVEVVARSGYEISTERRANHAGMLDGLLRGA